MPIDLYNSPETFQPPMNILFIDSIDDFMVLSLDDLIILSKTVEEYVKHLELVYSRLTDKNLYIKPEKCMFFAKETTFLCMIVGKNGISVNPEKVRIIWELSKPEVPAELRGFIQLLQFF